MALAESQLPRQRPPVAWRLAADETLARAAASGDQAAFAALFSRHQPALLRYCRSLLLDADAAQDAAQNAFTAALRALTGSGPEPVAVKGWLFRIAHNEAMRLLRTRSLDSRALQLTRAREAAALTAAPDDPTRERLRELVADLGALPERQRAALLMRELSGLTYGEIAGALMVSEGAARQSVCDARAGLHGMGAGRAFSCTQVRDTISDGDRRVLRGRGVRAHLASCSACAAFARRGTQRRRDLRILVPAGPFLGWTLLGGGGAAGGGVAGGKLALGLGASSVAKCAAICASAAVVGVGGVGALDSASDRVGTDRPEVALGGSVSRPVSGGRRPSMALGAAAAPGAAPRVIRGTPARAARPAAVVLPEARRTRGVERLPDRPDAESAVGRLPADSKAGREPTPIPAAPARPVPGAPPAPVPPAHDAGTSSTGEPANAAPKSVSPVTIPTAAELQGRVDAALAAARQSTEQALTGTAVTDEQIARMVADALALALSTRSAG